MHDSQQKLAEHLIELEQSLLKHCTRANAATLASLLADDFREFGRSGRIYNRKQIIDELTNESPANITLSDPVCQQLSDDVALLTYRSSRAGPLQTTIKANRSSLWAFRDGRWQMVFHQGTRI
jgi:hypothetical protein